jgi:hypothetical protein
VDTSPAYTLSVYAGDKDRDGFGVIWYAVGSGGYLNLLQSPVTYGVPPSNSEVADAPPLEAGKTYTVSPGLIDGTRGCAATAGRR